MNIHTLASGSKGNCYVLEHEGNYLMIEAGIPFSKLQKELWRLGASVSSLDGCLISHSHQ